MTVALVNMPFAPATRPSIQIGILAALLDGAGIVAREHHAAVDFYDRLRQAGALSQYTAQSPSMVSEWYFSERPFDPTRDMWAADRLRRHARDVGFPFSRMLALRNDIVPSFLDETAHAIAASKPRVVCFTLSYAQLNASFALAARLKALLPDVVTVFGGAGSQVHEEACRAYMGAFAAIDIMVLGEAEPVLVELLQGILDVGKPPVDLPDLMLRDAARIIRTPSAAAPPLLDASPPPRYDGWFETRGRMPMETRRDLEPVLLMELGRGCTWGDEMTCSFCAFIFHGRYRAKSRERVLDEVRTLTRRHGRKTIYLVDDIVTNAQISDLLPAMRQAVPGLLVHFMEMRTATTRRHVQALADSGVCLVQPGTECFDDGLLRRISKGTTTFHNVQFLRWAKEAGVRVSHNVLLNVPHATRDEVESQLAVIGLLTHLDPPFTFPLQIVRFSPYHADPEKHGLRALHPDPFYRFIFPDEVDPAHVAYELVEEGSVDPHAALHAETARAVHAWQIRWSRLPLPYLVVEADSEGAVVVDGRDTEAPRVHRLDALAAAVHAAVSECPQNAAGVVRSLRVTWPELDEACVMALLDDLVAKRLALHLRGRWLALATDAAATRRWQDVPPHPARR